MARRRTSTKLGDLFTLTVVGAVVYSVWESHYSQLTWILFGVATLVLWIVFLMPTRCDYVTLRNKPCSRPVRGKLRGCQSHARDKRDALWATIKLKNPGAIFRTMWASPAYAPTTLPRTGSSGSVSAFEAKSETKTPSKQSASDAAMLIFTVISTIAAIIALFK